MDRKAVLITGGSIGIGRATAAAFAKAGYLAMITDILESEGQSTAAEIIAGGGQAEFHKLDVQSTAEVETVVARIEQAHGPLAVVVANAGIAHKVPLAELSDEKWQHTIDIDLTGVFRTIRAALPGMRRRGSGAVIALSSIMGVAYGWDEHVQYSAAKAGVVGLVRGLAVELAPDGIRVNGIAPGYIRTAQALSVTHSLGPAGLDAAAKFIPLGRVGEPDEIADVALFLASDAARYITGQVLVVDGGLLVGRY